MAVGFLLKADYGLALQSLPQSVSSMWIRVRCYRQPCLDDFGWTSTIARSTYYGGHPNVNCERRDLKQLTLHESVAITRAYQLRIARAGVARLQTTARNAKAATARTKDTKATAAAKRHGLSPGSMKRYKSALRRLLACRIPGPLFGPRDAPTPAVDRDSIRVDLMPLFSAVGLATSTHAAELSESNAPVVGASLVERMFPDKRFRVTG